MGRPAAILCAFLLFVRGSYEPEGWLPRGVWLIDLFISLDRDNEILGSASTKLNEGLVLR
jgi:hypothetical protein